MELANFGIAIFSVLFALTASEVVLRFTDHQHLIVPYYSKYPDNYFTEDPDLGVDHAPNRPPQEFLFKGPSHKIFTNSIGCFDKDRTIEPGYILAIGDSGTWGYIALEEKWTTLLENRIGIPVVKCGVSGTGTRFQLIKAYKVIEDLGVKPSMIILGYTHANDLNDDIVFPGYTIFAKQRVNNLKFLNLSTGGLVRLTYGEIASRYRLAKQAEKERSKHLAGRFVTIALANRVINQFDIRLRSNKLKRVKQHKQPKTRRGILQHRYERSLLNESTETYPWLETAFSEHLNNIREFKRLALSHGTELVVLTKANYYSELGVRLTQFFDTEFEHHLNVANYIKERAGGRLTRYRYDSHANRLGNQLVAEALQKYLTDAELLPVTSE